GHDADEHRQQGKPQREFCVQPALQHDDSHLPPCILPHDGTGQTFFSLRMITTGNDALHGQLSQKFLMCTAQSITSAIITAVHGSNPARIGL
ncbi:MAG: hypothetical protein ACRETO_05175, partial [Gammaproteobacteria bacterium]